MKAAFWGNHDAVKTLLGAGASPNAQDNEGKTALMISEEIGQTRIAELINQGGDKA